MSSVQSPAIPGFPSFANGWPLADDLGDRTFPGLEGHVIKPGCLRCTVLLARTQSSFPHDLDQVTVGHWLSRDCAPAICCRSDQSAPGDTCANCVKNKRVEIWVPQFLLPYACRLWEAALLINILHTRLDKDAPESPTNSLSTPQRAGYDAAVGHFRLCADAWCSAYLMYKDCVLHGDDPLSAEAPRIQEWGLDQVHALGGLTPEAYAAAHPLLASGGAGAAAHVLAAPAVPQRSHIEQLRLWHQEYIAVDGDSLEADSDTIQAIESDELDHDEIELQVRQLMSTADVSQGFCGKCRYLLEHWPDLSTGEWAHTVGRSLDTKEIEAATRNGCKFCAFLLSKLRVTRRLDIFRKLEARLRALGDSGTASLSIQRWGGNDTLLLWVNFPGKIASGCNAPGAKIQVESRVISPIRELWRENLDIFDLAKVWIGGCSRSHERCGSGKKYARPTRLLSVNDERIKLVLTETWENMPQYATLSYCWGSGQFTKLTRENFHSFLRDIPLRRLPQTLQDAVYITRKLGLEYLWIDALCIIQDMSANADWVHEAALMSSVYGGSHINLAASSATSVHGGCFLKPENHSGGFCGRVTVTSPRTGDHLVVRSFHNGQVYEESTIKTHLAGRAWALQERLLAPRTLFFGDQGLFWECRTTLASEFVPDGFSGLMGSKLVQPEDKALDWGDIVQQYSRAALTFGTDRLPALSGIAARQRDVTGDDYLAGMWRRQLVMQLPWLVYSPQLRKVRPKWRAPSWSWISIDGPTTYCAYWHQPLAPGMKKYIYVLDAWTTPAGPDPCGQVEGGELSIGCSALIYGRVRQQHEDPGNISRPRVLLEAGTLPVPISIDCLDDETSIQNGGTVYLLPVFSSDSGYVRSRPRQDRESKRGKEHSEDVEWFSELVVRGLVLQRCGIRKGHFRRIGSFCFCHDPFPDENLEAEENQYYHELMAVMDKVGAVALEAEGAKVVSNSDYPEARYIITIE